MTSISQPAEAAAIPDDFDTWLGSRNKWLQTAAKHIIDTRQKPSQIDIDNWAQLCIDEAANNPNTKFETVKPGSLLSRASNPEVRLQAINDVKGVNAIKGGASLSFANSNLTVIYGANGAGKTGFARLIKQICGSRAKGPIEPNVFEDDNPKCSAKISLLVGEIAHEIDWDIDQGTVPTLQHAHVFDSIAATMYVENANQATYEPTRMRFVSTLIRTCDAVAKKIAADKLTFPKVLPQPPETIANTKASAWLKSLNSKMSAQDIGTGCAYTAEQDADRVTQEGALAQTNVAARLKAIGTEKTTLERIKSNLKLISDELTDEKIEALIDAREDAKTKREAATQGAKVAFGQAPLQGVGEKVWLELWSAARAFSTEHAYHQHVYPVVDDGARCVLCQQNLNDEGKARLSDFEKFVISGLEENAKTAESILTTLKGQLPNLPTEEAWTVSIANLKIPDAEALKHLEGLKKRKQSSLSAESMDQVSPFDWQPLREAYAAALTPLKTEENTLNELNSEEQRQILKKKVAELQGSQWLNQNQIAIKNELARLQTIDALDKAAALANTAALTKKNNELARNELDAGYQIRFLEELKKLGGSMLAVRPESNLEGKGKVTFGLKLHGAKNNIEAEKVLSEGEVRLIALAAFLADITGQSQTTPFIFDDPISSLDQAYEEKVVARLVELAQTRQVIVFTHRLSLVALVNHAIDKIKNQAQATNQQFSFVHKVETLRRFGKVSGLKAEVNIMETKPLKALNRLRNDVIPILKQDYQLGNVVAYEERAKGLCSEFRILVERCIEVELLNNVVHRFRRSIQTQNQIAALAKITSKDCNFIDDLMTRYSVYEHSQSPELIPEPPSPEEFETDFKSLINWINEFRNQAAT